MRYVTFLTGLALLGYVTGCNDRNTRDAVLTEQTEQTANVRRVTESPWYLGDVYAVTDTVTGAVCYTTLDSHGGLSCVLPGSRSERTPR